MNASTSLDRLFDAVEYLVDDRVGIVSYVKEVPRGSGAPDFFHFYAEACNTAGFARQKNFNQAGGASSDRRRALAKALGEAVERYCSAIYDVEEFPLVSFEAAAFPCVPPGEFALYSPGQYAAPDFPYVPFEPTTPVRWTAATDPATDHTWHVPAAFVFLPYSFNEDQGERPIAQRISTGLACHCSYSEAALSAICEVVERDAFTIAWQARLGMPQIRIDSLTDANRNLVARFERTGSSVTLLHMTLDVGIPTILSVLRSRSPESPSLVFAASADPDPEKAVRKSLEELAHTRRLAQHLKNTLPPREPGLHYENVLSQDDHVHLYCNHANAVLADFLFSSQERVSYDEIPSLTTGDPDLDLRVLVEKVAAVNHRVLLVDLTTPDVRGVGLRVVRAIIPGFHPLFMGYKLRALGGSRLWEAPQKLGYKGIARETGDNPAPHPYP